MELWVDQRHPVSTYKVGFDRERHLMSNSDLHLHEHTLTHICTHMTPSLPGTHVHMQKKKWKRKEKRLWNFICTSEEERKQNAKSYIKGNHLKFKSVIGYITIPKTYVVNWIPKIFYFVCHVILQEKKCIGLIMVSLGCMLYLPKLPELVRVGT